MTMNTTEEIEKPHHSYSPSTLQSLEACDYFRGKESKHERTIAGSRAHKVVETRVDDARLSDDDAEAAAECLDFVDQRRQLMEEARRRKVLERTAFHWGKPVRHVAESDAGKEAEAEVSPIIELREAYLPVDDLQFEDSYIDPLIKLRVIEKVFATTAGYVDHALISHDRHSAELIDFKFGFWPVESAENNLQGIAYALGLFREYPTIQRIIFWFKQPHIDSITSAEFNRENIDALYLRIQVVVARARKARHQGDFATATPAVPVCNFCALIGVCPKVAAFACKVGSKFFPLEIPDNITPTMLHNARDTTLGMRLAAVVAVWAKSFRTQVTDRVLRGDADIPAGFKVESRSSREIADAARFKDVSLKHITEKEYTDLQDPPGFGKIEKLITERAPRGQKKNAVQSFASELEATGAVTRESPYTFLKAIADTDTDTNKTTDK